MRFKLVFKLNFAGDISMKFNWFLRVFVFSVIFNSYIALAHEAVQNMPLPHGEATEDDEESVEIENAEPINDGSDRYRFSIDELSFLSDVSSVYDNISGSGWVEEVGETISLEEEQIEKRRSSPWQHNFQHQEFVHVKYRGLIDSLEILPDELRELNENLSRANCLRIYVTECW